MEERLYLYSISASGRHSHENFFEMKTSFWQVQVSSKNKEKDVQFLLMQYKALNSREGKKSWKSIL
jgi:hypothetical protein